MKVVNMGNERELRSGFDDMPVVSLWNVPVLRRSRFYRYGYFSFWNRALVGPGLKDAPSEILRSGLAHEYGHIAESHGFYMAGGASLIVVVSYLSGMLFPAFRAALVSSGVAAAMLAFLGVGRYLECRADDMAVKICGRNEALRASLWFAEKCGTIKQTERRKRLLRLGWDGKATWRDIRV